MQRYANLLDLEKMLKNDYLVAKIGFDTAENELSKVCGSKKAIATPGHKFCSVSRCARTVAEVSWLLEKKL